jgi:predicted ATP-binding protein involved in virulence
MLRKLFQSSSAGVEIPGSHEESLDALAGNINRSQTRELESAPKVAGLGRFESFDEIYRSGPANQPSLAYDIMKVAQMLESPHIATMSSESKRGSLMMALEAAGVEPKDILQDAMVRQRALSDYEEAQQKKLRDFESHKAELNREIQEELDRINGEYLARIQANVNEVAKQQDSLRAWQKSKQRELAVMAEACGYLAPPDIAANNLAAALDRAARR